MSWQSEPLSALTLKIGSGSTPRGGDSVYISEGTTLIRSQNVYNNEFSTDGLVYIDEKTAEKIVSHIFRSKIFFFENLSNINRIIVGITIVRFELVGEF